MAQTPIVPSVSGVVRQITDYPPMVHRAWFGSLCAFLHRVVYDLLGIGYISLTKLGEDVYFVIFGFVNPSNHFLPIY